MSERTLSFQVLRPQLYAMRAVLSAQGINLPDGDSGEVDGPHGFKINFHYTEPTLLITLDGAWVLMSTAVDKVRDAITPFTV